MPYTTTVTQQLIATYLASSQDMQSFLQAFPRDTLAEPLKALLELYDMVKSRKFIWPTIQYDHGANQPLPIRLWPDLRVPNVIEDKRVLMLLEKAIVLYNYVVIDDIKSPPKLPTTTTLPLRLQRIKTIEEFNLIAHWSHRIQSLEVYFTRDSSQSIMNQLCDKLLSMPALQKVDFVFLDSIPALQTFNLVRVLSQTNVVDISFRSSYLSLFWPREIVNLFASWVNKKPLRSIVLDDINVACDECAEILFSALFNTSTSKSLTITSSLSKRLFRTTITIPPTFKKLDAMVCIENDKDYEFIQSTLQNTKLEKLIFRNDCIDSDVSDGINDLLSNLLPTLSQLESLRLHHYFRITTSINALASILPQLKCFQLFGCLLEDAVIAPIIAAIPQCKRLENLCLSGNKLTYLTAKPLAEALAHSPTIRQLQLGDNTLGSIGAFVLCPLVRKLQVLDLSQNEIGFDGATAISRVLQEAPYLLSLDLHGNLLSTQGALAILKTLASCPFREGVVNLHYTITPGEDFDVCHDAWSNLPDKSWCLLSQLNNN